MRAARARGSGNADVWERIRSPHPPAPVVWVATCPGSLIVHTDGTVAGCTNDELEDGCNGADTRHQGDPLTCWR